MPEKIPEPMNTRSFGVVMALSQLGEQPALAGLGTLGVEIKRLIAESREIVADATCICKPVETNLPHLRGMQVRDNNCPVHGLRPLPENGT